VKLNWQVTRQDIENAFNVQKIIGEEIEKNRLGKFFMELKKDIIPHGLHGGYHHMGTTRMSNDTKKGVVDINCKVYGTSNLFIAGPSVFPTGGYANPVLTIIALTLRLSEHLQRFLSTK
jgi:choline dehydrogenase-like flavoprotein